MTSTAGIINTAASVQTTQPVVAPAKTPNAAITGASIASQNQTVSISPRIVVDPTAGIITQYLNSSGKVEVQFPSTVVVAYLRAGLTSEGVSRHTITGGTPTEHSRTA